MRPKSIVNFERAVLAMVGLGIVNSFVTREQAETAMADAGMGGTGMLTGILVVGTLLNLLLLYFISRKASPVAKWIYVVLTALGLVFGLAGIGQVLKGNSLSVILTIVQYVLAAASLYLLFRPDANAWFNDGRGTIGSRS